MRRIQRAAYGVPIDGFTQAVEVTGSVRYLFLSGVTARDADGRVTGVGDLARQTEQVYRNVEAILAEADASFTDVVRVVTYLRNIKDHAVMQAVRRRYWPDHAPASTTVEVSRLYDEEQLIEVEITAAVPAGRAGTVAQAPASS